MRDRLLIIVIIAAIIGGVSAIVFVFNKKNSPVETFVEPIEEIPVEEPAITVAQGGITVVYYGGPADVKTITEGGIEYALIRNPENVGGLTLALSDVSGTYYYALDSNGNKILYAQGDSKGLHGYEEQGEVSGMLIRNRIPATEYFVAYPDETSARLANIEPVADTGIANRYLSSQVAVITNKNTGRSVVAEIDHRSEQNSVMLVSEAVGRELQLDSGATANLLVELVPRESVVLGPVR